jgi:glycosyltransferase involved in cell wall biosynthesis
VSAGNLTLALLRKVNDAISLPLIRKHADLIFAITQPIKDSLISSGINEGKILVTENAISKVEYSATPQPVLFDACFVGRLEKGKGILDLVAIWRIISDKIPSAKLAMIGIGSDKDHLVSLIERDRLTKNIILCGFVDEKKKFEVMQRSRLFVLPSYVDAKPIAILEAMSCGLPVLAYDLSALKSIWQQDIVCIPQGDTASFAKTVLELLEDPQKRLVLSRRGLNRSKDARTWKDIATYEVNAIKRA